MYDKVTYDGGTQRIFWAIFLRGIPPRIVVESISDWSDALVTNNIKTPSSMPLDVVFTHIQTHRERVDVIGRLTQP